ncbi:MAG TPA: histidine--tRNA ligase [Anaerolineales bacterium]|nr:histidine--tRNA ligase [Anaerolineales bacterium]
MTKTVPSVKGTRDFYPQDMAMRSWLYDNIRQVSESFGYQEYEGPFLESIELYAARSGDELVKEQSFVFPDRGGNLITLRPELTPTLTRMVAQRQNELSFPLRWWSFGPFWRYERPQKGRTREFFQWNIDLIGVDTPEADAELVAIITSFFKRVGLSPQQAVILVNNRQLMEGELASLRIGPDQKKAVFQLIDRLDKLPAPAWEELAGEIGLSLIQIADLRRLLADTDLWQKSDSLVRFFPAIAALEASEYVRYASQIIRGLDYYTGTVFEAESISGDLRRSILGGGRYDNLVSDVGGQPLPAVGFAMGDVVISIILQELGLVPPDLGRSTADLLVTAFDETHLPASLTLAAELRSQGIKVASYVRADKLAKQFKYADRNGIKIVLVLGPDELAHDLVTVKDLSSGEQQNVPRTQLTERLRQLLS